MPNIDTTGTKKAIAGAKLYGQDSGDAAGFFLAEDIAGFPPAGLAMTTSAAVTEAQLLANGFFTNYGASGAVVATLPAVSYPITRTFLVQAAQVFSIKPPSGETLDTTITPALDADDKISSPETVHTKAVATRCRTGASAWVWSIDVVRGTWTDGGA